MATHGLITHPEEPTYLTCAHHLRKNCYIKWSGPEHLLSHFDAKHNANCTPSMAAQEDTTEEPSPPPCQQSGQVYGQNPHSLRCLWRCLRQMKAYRKRLCWQRQRQRQRRLFRTGCTSPLQFPMVLPSLLPTETSASNGKFPSLGFQIRAIQRKFL